MQNSHVFNCIKLFKILNKCGLPQPHWQNIRSNNIVGRLDVTLLVHIRFITALIM